MPESSSDLGEKLTRLAEGVLDEMLDATDIPALDQRIEAIKVIGTLHLGLQKLKGGAKSDEESSGGMADMRRKIQQAGEGK